MLLRIPTALRSAIWILWFACPAAAQNLIVNPTFDDALNGWTTTGGSWTVVVDNSDFCVQVDELVGEGVYIGQCVPATGERLSEFGMWSRLSSGDSRDILYQWTFYSGSDCSEEISSGPHVHTTGLASEWVSFRMSDRAPAGTQSVQIWIGPPAGDPAVVLIDDVSVVTALFDDDFESGTLEMWSRVVPEP